MRLDAFEQYIRGLLADEDEIRIRDLKEAARLEPDWPEPSFALSETYYARNDCAAALPWFARVPATRQNCGSRICHGSVPVEIGPAGQGRADIRIIAGRPERTTA